MLSIRLVCLSAALVAFGPTLCGSPPRIFLPYDDLPNFVDEDGWRVGSFAEQLSWALGASTGLVFEPVAWWIKSSTFRWWSGGVLDPTGFAQVSAAAHLATAWLLAAALETVLAAWLAAGGAGRKLSCGDGNEEQGEYDDDASNNVRTSTSDDDAASSAEGSATHAPPPAAAAAAATAAAAAPNDRPEARLEARLDLRACSALTACWWCVHPLRAEVVGWCSGQSYAFAALFSAASLLLHAKARRLSVGSGGGGLGAWAGGLACYLAGSCCKTVAVPLPALLAAVELMRPMPLPSGGGGGGGVCAAARLLCSHVLAALWPLVSAAPGGGGGVCWHLAAGAWVASRAAAANSGGQGVGTALRRAEQRVAVSAATLRRYGAQLAAPDPSAQLGAFYAADVRGRVRWPWSRGAGAGDEAGTTLLLVAAVCAVLLLAAVVALGRASGRAARQGQRAVRVPAATVLAALWCCALLSVLPTLSIFAHGSDSAGADRYLHIPTFAALPALAAALLWCARKLGAPSRVPAPPPRPEHTLVLAALAAALLLPLSLGTAGRLRGWATPRVFYAREHAASPASPHVLNDLVKAHMDAGDGRSALRAFDAALAGSAAASKERLLADANLMATATALLTRTPDHASMRAAPGRAAVVLLTDKPLPRYAEAVALSAPAVRWTPARKVAPLLFNVGRAHLQLGQHASARKAFTRVVDNGDALLVQAAKKLLLIVDEREQRKSF